MARDLYADAHTLAAALSDAGLASWADRIEDIISGGATATEILMGLRWTLGELLAQEEQLVAALRARAVALERDLGEVLG
jgi:hypothetical protein